jgi:hypothetical protein
MYRGGCSKAKLPAGGCPVDASSRAFLALYDIVDLLDRNSCVGPGDLSPIDWFRVYVSRAAGFTPRPGLKPLDAVFEYSVMGGTSRFGSPSRAAPYLAAAILSSV